MANLLYIEINNTIQTLILENLALSGDILSIDRDKVGVAHDLSLPVTLKPDGYYIGSLYLEDKYSAIGKIVVECNGTIVKEQIPFQNDVYYDIIVFEDEVTTRYRLRKMELSLLNSDATIFQLPKSTITFGCANTNDIFVPKKNISKDRIFEISYADKNHYVESKQGEISIHINGYRTNRRKLEYGDLICSYGVQLIYLGDCILVYDQGITVKLKAISYNIAKLVISDEGQGTHYKNKVYSRNPRIVDSVNSSTVRIEAPPRPEQLKKMPAILQVGPSLTMALAMVVTLSMAISSAVNGGSIASVVTSSAMCFAMLLGAVLWPLLTRKYQAKQLREAEQLRCDRYTAYLDRKESEIQSRNSYNKNVLDDLYLSSTRIINIVEQDNDIHKYLYNKLSGDSDFLCVRLGCASLPPVFNIEAPDEAFTLFDDPLMERAIDIKNKYQYVESAPLSLDLKKHRVIGVVGKNRIDIVQTIILSLAFSHSYEDVKCAFIHNSCDSGRFQWCKNLSHTHSDDGDNMYVACNSNEVHALMCELSKIFEANEEEEKQNSNKQHFVIFILSKELVEHESLMAKFINQDSDLPVTLIYVGEEITSLPGECSATIYGEADKDYLYTKNDETQGKIQFVADYVDDDAFVRCIQKLASYKLNVKARTAGMPSNTTFLDLYKVGGVEQLNIKKRWEESDVSRSMAVPVGVKAGGALLYLDIHESAHGPHGLVAGMTGSGKSEMIQSFILSLAVNFHPDDVSFVIVDFKGGGMADTLIGIPHIAGKITNLSGAELSRAMISIDAELKRRQVLLQLAGKEISSIDKYNRLRKSGRLDLEPLPHLIIVVDEFAQLKAQHPEFMRKLIDVAQIGRSLGIHLILATQKPSGIVDDQIWGNSRFRLCLKVLQKQDSVDLIRRPDAARIKFPGRTYLQVGYDEVFDCFQSGYSGATYRSTDTYRKSGDNVLSLIDSLGNVVEARELLTDAEIINKKNKFTQLRAVVNYITDEGKNILPHILWMDPLPAIISLDDIADKSILFDETGWKANNNLSATIGMIDVPAKQNQMNYTVDLENGNVGIYGGAGTGKTILLQTLLFTLCMKYSPDFLKLHIFDFGGRSFGVFENMPHIVGKVIYSDNENGVNEKVQELGELLEERKKMFGKYSATSLAAFNRSSSNKLPAVIVVIDNYSVVNDYFSNDTGRKISLGRLMTKIAREGNSYGIYCILTGASKSAIFYKTADFVPQSICMRMPDRNAYREILKANVSFDISEYVGRGICVFDKAAVEFQSAIIGGLSDDYERAMLIKKIGFSMQTFVSGEAEPLEAVVSDEDLMGVLTPINGGVPLGWTPAGNQVCSMYDQKQSLILTGNKEAELYNYLLMLVELMKRNEERFYCFDIGKRFEETIVNIKEMEDCVRELAATTDNDLKIVTILDFQKFIEAVSDEAGELFKKLVWERRERGIVFVVADLASNMGVLSFFSDLKKNAMGVFVGNDIKKQILFDYKSFPSYDSELLEKISGLAYDYQTQESKFIVL